MSVALLIFLFLLINAVTTIILKSIALGPGGSSYLALALDSRFYLASLLFASQAIVWLSVLRRVPLSQAYPFTSLKVVIVLATAAFFFNENISMENIFGSLVIMAGVYVIARG